MRVLLEAILRQLDRAHLRSRAAVELNDSSRIGHRATLIVEIVEQGVADLLGSDPRPSCARDALLRIRRRSGHRTLPDPRRRSRRPAEPDRPRAPRPTASTVDHVRSEALVFEVLEQPARIRAAAPSCGDSSAPSATKATSCSGSATFRAGRARGTVPIASPPPLSLPEVP